MFVKPARLGSSVGISKAGTREEFAKAIAEAFRHDRKILVEEYVRGREIECGVLEGEDGSLTASAPGEIVPSNRHGFYTYEAKYLDEEGAAIKVPADLPRTSATKFASCRSRPSARSAARAWPASTFFCARTAASSSMK